MEERVDVRGQLGGSREDWGPWSSPWTSVWGHVSRGLPGQGGSQGRSCILRFCFPGCFSIQGPESVRGPEKGSVTVQCHYKPGWEIYRKWWCRGARWDLCRILIKTTGSEQKVKEDRVSIRDDQRDRVLTVTMEELRRDDAGTYWCGIERTGVDLGTRVKVAIDPEGTVLSTPASPPTANNHTGVSSGTSVRTHYMLLVFVKVPVLLILVGVVLWLKGPQRVPKEQWEEPIYTNLSSDLLTKDTAP
ncbi:CMRF35-like molecule 7 isoform X2 [Diceros bicornis minor]|uniref:CMRF35-like molecule 7 isoform X2 n=1 Tax=Diceros bicornis minor TaxID=77932 RepID=UPI0026EFF4CE|nr:CMRF35-like molecule 7 isoform X2 [Diceros bicornis minor]